jgi:alpha-tubulin suppressor-like RCC1 family protein
VRPRGELRFATFVVAAVAFGCGACRGRLVPDSVEDAGGISGDFDSGAPREDGGILSNGLDSGAPRGDDGGTDSSGVPAARVASVSAGTDHACAVTVDGAAKCWGYNASGQLGNDSTINSDVPVDVVGLSSGVVAIAAGTHHTCAVTQGGAVKCWGINDNGQLGDNTGTERHVPTDVVGLSSGVAAVSAGNGATCAVVTGGGVSCWGNNELFTNYSPYLSSGVVAVSVGSADADELHACTLTSAGAVFCWGSNMEGQLGTPPAAPSGFTLSSGTREVSAGQSFTCASTVTGAVDCWGSNMGLFGDFSTKSTVPVDVPGFSSGVVAISAGGAHACVVTSAGAAQCWGVNNEGQLGDGSTTDRHTPTNVVGLSSGTRAISAGIDYTCALTVAGAVKCWGENIEGKLGNGTTVASLTPAEVIGL